MSANRRRKPSLQTSSKTGVLVILAGTCTVGLSGYSALAQENAVPAVPAPVTAPSHLVTGVVIKYVRENSDQPPAASLLEAIVDAAPTQDGWAAPRPREMVQRFRLADVPRLQQQRF